MKEKVISIIAGALAVPVTIVGFDAWVKAATNLVGLATACVGCATGVVILVYWIRKYRKKP